MLHQRGSLPVLRIGPLQPLRKGHSQRSDQEGILTIRFFRPAPARIAAEVGVGRAHDDSAPVVFRALVVVASLVPFKRGDLLQQLRIPSSAQTLFLRKGRGRKGLLSPAAPAAWSTQRQPMQTLHLTRKNQPQPGILRVVRHQLDLLVERQPPQQIGNALVIAQTRIPKGVIRLRRGRQRHTRNKSKTHQPS